MRVLSLLLLAALLAQPGPPARGQDRMRFFSLGSGDVSGGYYAAAREICAAVNRAAEGALRCSPEPTAGSLYNLTMLAEGELDFAFAQSDWQREAYEGGGAVAGGAPMPGLRSVMALYPEMVTVLAWRGSGVTRLADLAGKRVDIGLPGSGRNASLTRLFAAIGFGAEETAAFVELPAATAFEEICAGRLDASVAIVGHPNPGIAQALASCDIDIVPVGASPQVAAALEATPGLRRATIPRAAYPELTADVATYAVIATIVTLAETDPRIVERLVAAVLADLPQLAVRAPVLAGVNIGGMRTEGLTAPLHPGAEAAFAAFGE